MDENMKPLVLPQGREIFHRNRPIVSVSGKDRDWIAYADGGWPWGMDGAGRRALTFPPPDEKIDWNQAARMADKNRMDDMGYSYAIKNIEAASLSNPLIAIYNRRFVWFYLCS